MAEKTKMMMMTKSVEGKLRSTTSRKGKGKGKGRGKKNASASWPWPDQPLEREDMAEKTKMMMTTRSVEGKLRSTTSRKGKGKGKGKKNASASWPWPDQHQHHPFPLLLSSSSSSSTTQWHDLPREVWQIIFIIHLPILDQISFRLVCKYWYMVSCSTKLESLPLEYQQQSLCPTQSPWVIIVKPSTRLWFDPKDQVSPEFVELSTGRVYNMKDYIPDLFKPNSRVLKSAYGWLLVLQRQDYSHYKEDPECAVSPGRQPLFFLNPFTRARIDIHVPRGSIGQSFLNDLADNNDPQCALSAPPTRKDCILFLIIRTCCINRNFKIVTFLHNSRGADHVHNSCGGGRARTPAPPGDFHCCFSTMKQFSAGNVKSVVRLPFDNRVRNVVYWDGFFYCVHAEGYISSYSVSSKEWLMLGRPKMLPPKQQNLHIMSYLIRKPPPVVHHKGVVVVGSSISRAFLCIGICRQPRPDHARYGMYFIELLDGRTLKQRLDKRKETPNIDWLPTFRELKPFKSKTGNKLYRSKHLLFPMYEGAIRRSCREVRLDSFSRFAWMCNFINENKQHDQHDNNTNNNTNNSSTTGSSDAVDDDYEPDDQDEKPRQICYRRKLAFEPSYPDQNKATQILWIEPTWVNS